MFGLAAGVFITILPKIIEETVPHKYYARFFGASTNIFVMSYFIFNSWMTCSIPEYNIMGPNLKTQMAKSFPLGFFNYIPIPFMLVGLAATMKFLSHDPLYFLILKDDHENAVHVISQIYVHSVEHEY